jgi:hypothetical protein
MAYGLRRRHAHQTIQQPLLLCGWGHYHGNQIDGLPSIFIHDPKHDGMLIA